MNEYKIQEQYLFCFIYKNVQNLHYLSILLVTNNCESIYNRHHPLPSSNISCLLAHMFRYYEGCSNMNASGFITFLTFMLRQNSKRFYKGLYVTFKVAPDLKKNTVSLSSYSPLNEGHVCILTNSMLRTYTSDRDERIILLRTGEIS